MSHRPGTVLCRKEPFDAGAPDAPYNEVEVIGPSPVQRQVRSSEFVGQLGDLLSVRPSSFGPVIDVPQGQLQRDYDVVSIPPPPQIDRQIVEHFVPGPSPEEQFAADAAKQFLEPALERVVTVPPDAPSPEDVFADGDPKANKASM